MPIVRTYACPECNNFIEVTLNADQWEAPPPSCPVCDAHEMQQEFRPVAIGGSLRSKASKIAEDIIEKDYNVADFKAEGKEGHSAKVRYKDQTPADMKSTWTAATSTIEAAIATGRETRLKYGSGLDVLQHALKTGQQPDLLAESKKRMIKVW